MKRMLMTLAVAIALTLSALGGASAAPSNHATPPVRGASNCHGQTAAYLAQASRNGLTGDVVVGPGLGNLASASNLSVTDVQARIDEYCSVTTP